MRTIKIAFYHAKHGTLQDKLIAFFTKGEFSHVEIVFEDGTAYSSSPRDGGVRAKNIHFDAQKWHILEVEISPIEYNTLRKYLHQRIGIQYDWIAIFGHFIGITHGNKYTCTEIISEGLSFYTQILHNVRHGITPDELYAQIANYKQQ
jgi:hypothetical protein